MTNAISPLETAINALEAQRSILGDLVVDAALIPLRQQLETIRQGEAAAPSSMVNANSSL